MGLYGIVDRRANSALNQLATCFNERKSTNENQIPLIKGVKKIDASYFLQNKWMGRVYIYQWRVLIEGKRPENIETIRLKYGKKGIIYFRSLQEQKLCKQLEQHKSWEQIKTAIDFEKLELRYNEQELAWEVTIWPNFGDYIWILIPPVRYYRKPLQIEKNGMNKLLEMFVQVLNKK